MPGPNVTPAINETQAPYQFDGTVNIGGANATAALSVTDPAKVGLQAWTFPLYLATGTAATRPAAGTLQLAQLNLSAGALISNLYLSIATTASAFTSGSNFAGLYNSAGTLVATTADVTTALGTTASFRTLPLSTPYTVAASGAYWVGAFFNATTVPALTVLAGGTALATFATAAVGPVAAAASYPFATNTTGATTAMPATITTSNNSLTSAVIWWAGVS